MKITLKVKLQEYAKVSHEQYTKGMIGRNELEKRMDMINKEIGVKEVAK